MLNRSPLIALSSLAILACLPPAEEAFAPVLTDTEAYIEREILVAVDWDEDGSRLAGIQQDFGLTLLEHNAEIGVSRVWIEGLETEKQMAELVSKDDRVSFAEPNYIAVAASADDPYASYQWNLDRIGAPEALAYGAGQGITVAVLDTGVLSGGPDGIGRVLSGYDFYYGDSDPSDRDGHGTFVAGTIAQSTGNGVGVAGVAPDASILPVKVLSDQGYGDIGAIANGITWAADQGAEVVNMSLGSAYPSQTLERACTYAYERGTVLVAATGNEFASRLNYPAAYDTVIAVGATRADDSRAGYSNTGSGIDFMAPGGDLSRDDNGDGYADGVLQETIEGGQWTYTFWEGTSMAAPHVAAAAALIMAQGDFSPSEVYDILASTTRDLGSSGYDTQTGYGLIHIEAAVALAASGGGSSPAEAPTDTTEESPSDSGDSSTPEISGVTGWSDGNSFTVQWTTNEPADSYIDFEEYGVYGDANLTTSHTLRFQAQTGMSFVFTLMSTDADGNTTESGPWSISV